MKSFLWLAVMCLMVVTSGRVMAVEFVAHRGASFDAPENTLAAYRLAWQQNADAIEGDFRFTKDGLVVCMHDATVQRTAGGKKTKVADLTFDELRKLDAGTWKNASFKGEQVPTLKEILAVVPKGKRILMEIKIGAEILADVRKQIETSGLEPSQILIISFDDKVIAAAKKLMPQIKAYWIYQFKKKDGKWSMQGDEVLARARQINADGLSFGFTAETREAVNQDLAGKIHQAKLELNLWTIDDLALARQALQLDPTSITTNRPGWLRAELGK